MYFLFIISSGLQFTRTARTLIPNIINFHETNIVLSTIKFSIDNFNYVRDFTFENFNLKHKVWYININRES